MLKLTSLLSQFAVNSKCTVRCASQTTLGKLYRSQFYPKVREPPYDHICQIGDPVLREPCQPVVVEQILNPGIQNIIKKMWEVLENFECVGLSAPQIGVPLQIIVMKLTVPDNNKSPVISPIESKVIINPRMKILDYKHKEQAPEVCASVKGLRADVYRYWSIEVEAFSEKGDNKKWTANGYEARVLQHEIDHLSGTLYTDKMVPRTLECPAWQQINYHGGKIGLKFSPRKRGLLEKLKL